MTVLATRSQFCEPDFQSWQSNFAKFCICWNVPWIFRERVLIFIRVWGKYKYKKRNFYSRLCFLYTVCHTPTHCHPPKAAIHLVRCPADAIMSEWNRKTGVKDGGSKHTASAPPQVFGIYRLYTTLMIPHAPSLGDGPRENNTQFWVVLLPAL